MTTSSPANIVACRTLSRHLPLQRQANPQCAKKPHTPPLGPSPTPLESRSNKQPTDTRHTAASRRLVLNQLVPPQNRNPNGRLCRQETEGLANWIICCSPGFGPTDGGSRIDGSCASLPWRLVLPDGNHRATHHPAVQRRRPIPSCRWHPNQHCRVVCRQSPVASLQRAESTWVPVPTADGEGLVLTRGAVGEG